MDSFSYIITFSKEEEKALDKAKELFSKYNIEYKPFKYLNGFGFQIGEEPEFYQLGLFEGLISLPNSKLEQANVFHPITRDSLEGKASINQDEYKLE
jgi:hypothetical protein